MAFVKKPKLCQDAPAGFQQINGLVDNLDSLKDELELEHSPLYVDTALVGVVLGEPGNYEGPGSTSDFDVTVPGVHDTPLIARGAAFVKLYTASGGVSTPQLYFHEGCLRSFAVLDVGVYFFPVYGFSKVWGRATPDGSAVTPTLDVRVNPSAPSDGLGTGLIVRTFQKQDNSFVEEEMLSFDLGFHLLCFGRK